LVIAPAEPVLLYGGGEALLALLAALTVAANVYLEHLLFRAAPGVVPTRSGPGEAWF
jgi:hypothetical protein